MYVCFVSGCAYVRHIRDMYGCYGTLKCVHKIISVHVCVCVCMFFADVCMLDLYVCMHVCFVRMRMC